MKKTTKRLTALLMALMVLLGMQVISFAQVNSAEESSVAEAESDAGTEASAEEQAAETTPTTTAGDNPETGATALPFAAAVLAAAAVPVILKTRK